MLKGIVLLAIFVALGGLGTANYLNSSNRRTVTMNTTIAADMAGNLIYGADLCSQPGSCPAGSVNMNAQTTADMQYLNQMYTLMQQEAQSLPPSNQIVTAIDQYEKSLSGADHGLGGLFGHGWKGGIDQGTIAQLMAALQSAKNYIQQLPDVVAKSTQGLSQFNSVYGSAVSNYNSAVANAAIINTAAAAPYQQKLLLDQAQLAKDKAALQSAEQQMSATRPYAVIPVSPQSSSGAVTYTYTLPGAGAMSFSYPSGTPVSVADEALASAVSSDYPNVPFQIMDGASNPIYNMTSVSGRSTLDPISTTIPKTKAYTAAYSAVQQDQQNIAVDQENIANALASQSAVVASNNSSITQSSGGGVVGAYSSAQSGFGLGSASSTPGLTVNQSNTSGGSAAMAASTGTQPTINNIVSSLTVAKQLASEVQPAAGFGSDQSQQFTSSASAYQGSTPVCSGSGTATLSSYMSCFAATYAKAQQGINALAAAAPTIGGGGQNNISTQFSSSTYISVVTDGQGDVAVWWNSPGGMLDDVSNGQIVAQLGMQPVVNQLMTLSTAYESGFWEGKGVFDSENGAGNYPIPSTLIPAIEGAPNPPPPGTAMLVFSPTE